MAPHFLRSEWDWHEGPWAKDSIWNGKRLNLPTILGLSALFDQETAEFTNLSDYQKWSPSCAHSIGHPMFYARKYEILMIFGHFDPLKDTYLGGYGSGKVDLNSKNTRQTRAVILRTPYPIPSWNWKKVIFCIFLPTLKWWMNTFF